MGLKRTPLLGAHYQHSQPQEITQRPSSPLVSIHVSSPDPLHPTCNLPTVTSLPQHFSFTSSPSTQSKAKRKTGEKMLKEESTTSVLEMGSNNSKKWARLHERSWLCEACESAPAAFICKADAASLCVTCDAEIHSANPLARRHHRVPIMPVPGSLYGPSVADPDKSGPAIRHGPDADDGFLTHEAIDDEDDQDEASSWLLLNPVKNNNTNNQTGNGFLFGGEVVDEYLDLDEYNSGQENHQCTEEYNNHHQQQQQQQHGNVVVPQKSYGGDSVVPVQSVDAKGQIQQQQQYLSYHMETVEYETPKTGYGYPASLSHSVSISSMDVGVVPESTMSDVSISHPRPPKGTIELFSSPPIHMATQLTPMDREARVLRYREKKKTRKFEKTIRYASRKAYAETRPRIKGRFAKRTDVEVEVDQMFSTTLMTEGGYGIVPSF